MFFCLNIIVQNKKGKVMININNVELLTPKDETLYWKKWSYCAEARIDPLGQMCVDHIKEHQYE